MVKPVVMDEAFNFAAAIGNIRRSDYGRRMKPYDEKPVLDLDRSEWGEADRRQPFLGVNGKHFLLMFVLAFPVTALATLVVTGRFPYWVKPLLELLASPFW